MQKFIILNGSSTNSTSEGYITIPIKTFSGGHASSDTVLELYFEPILEDAETQGMDQFMVSLTIASNKHKETLQDIVKEFSTGEKIYIEFDKETESFPSTHISDVAWTFVGGNMHDMGWHGHRSRIKILPKDFIAADNGRPVMMNDASIGSSLLFLFSDGSSDMFATVAVPLGFKATQVRVYGSDTSQDFYVYKGDITHKVIVDVGTGATSIDSLCTLATEVTADDTNYLVIRVTSDGSSDEIDGGYVTIASVFS
tara:strand:- start:4929 stop:5693 length:765 start_codon:yes stop_codon:yes gene_type:complete